MHLERSGAKKLVTFAIYCTDSWESCDIENEKSIGDFCGELQRVFESSKNRVFYKYANLSFFFFIKGGYFFYKKCAFS